jgi:hypothetical protein
MNVAAEFARHHMEMDWQSRQNNNGFLVKLSGSRSGKERVHLSSSNSKGKIL